MVAANPYQAQYAITDLGPATSPLLGTELMEAIQAGQSTQMSVNQILAFAAAQLPLGFYTAKSVNFNAGNTDTQIPVLLPQGFTAYRVAGFFIANSSGTLTTATCGLFTASGGGGVAIVTGATAITVSTNAANTNNNMQSFTINNQNTQSYTATPLFFRIATPQGVAATADVTLQITPLA